MPCFSKLFPAIPYGSCQLPGKNIPSNSLLLPAAPLYFLLVHYDAWPCYSKLFLAIPWYSVLFHTIPGNVIPIFLLFQGVPNNSLLFHKIPGDVISGSSMLFQAIPCCSTGSLGSMILQAIPCFSTRALAMLFQATPCYSIEFQPIPVTPGYCKVCFAIP